MQPEALGNEGFMFNRPIDFGTVPLALLSPIFGQFEDDFYRWPDSELGSKEYIHTRELTFSMAELFEDEFIRRRFFHRWLETAYGVKVERQIDTQEPDGHVEISTDKGPFLLLITQCKNEISEGQSEPHWQGMGYYRKYQKCLLDMDVAMLAAHGSCLPALLITYIGENVLCLSDNLYRRIVGTYIDVSGLVMHRSGAIQMEPLTCGMRLDCDWRSDDQRNMIVRFVRALRIALDSLKDHYRDAVLFQRTVPPASYGYKKRVEGDDYKIRCWFPYPQSYSTLKEGKQISFRFEDCLLSDRLVFLAQEDDTNRLLLIKFVRQYAKDVHQLLAENKLAPSLYGYEDLPGRWAMVVMEYLPREEWVMLSEKSEERQKAYEGKIKEALDLIHEDGWVHGDVRHANILVPFSDDILDIRLIDFDNSGKEGVGRYPRDWRNPSGLKGAEEGDVLLKEHDIENCRVLFTVGAAASGRGMFREAVMTTY
jgi:hypothetical protein